MSYLNVEEGEAKSSGDDIDGGARVFAHSVAHFGVDVGKLFVKSFTDDGPAFARQRSQFGDGKSPVSVRVG